MPPAGARAGAAGARLCAAGLAAAPRRPARRHALAAFLGEAPALLAGGLDLGQVVLVARPLHADLLTDELLDRLDVERARLVGQADRLARGARPGGTADAVHV